MKNITSLLLFALSCILIYSCSEDKIDLESNANEIEISLGQGEIYQKFAIAQDKAISNIKALDLTNEELYEYFTTDRIYELAEIVMDTELKALIEDIRNSDKPEGLDLSEYDTFSINDMHPDDLRSSIDKVFSNETEIETRGSCRPGWEGCLAFCTTTTLSCIFGTSGTGIGPFLCLIGEILCFDQCNRLYCEPLPTPPVSTGGGGSDPCTSAFLNEADWCECFPELCEN